MTEIRPYMEPVEPVAACRVLVQNGVVNKQYAEAADVLARKTAEIEARLAEEAQVAAEKQAQEEAWKLIPYRDSKPRQSSIAAARKRAKKKGTWGGNNRIAGLTVEAIVELQAQGLGFPEIARQFGCDACVVSDRLIQYRKEHPEFVALEAQRRVCKCGKPKLVCKPQCIFCTRKLRRAEKAAQPKAKRVFGVRKIDKAKVLELHSEGRTNAEIAAEIGCKQTSIVKVLWLDKRAKEATCAG